MFLKNIRLNNFRNYTKLNLEFSPVTLLLGDNAQGKSNILEAIYFLATTKSVRVEKDSQLIRQGESYLIAEAELDLGSQAEDVKVKLEIAMQSVDSSLTKRTKVNGVPRRVVDYIGNLVVVSFTPEDINLVTGSPALRRWHIDLTLAQFDREYKKALTEYSEVTTSRNRVLKKIKEGLAKTDELTFWSEKAVESGLIVGSKRRNFFEYIDQNSMKAFGDFSFKFMPSEINTQRLQEYQGREIAAGTTLIGPHRDDFIFMLKGQPLSIYGSRGEQRTAVLDLKLLELNYISQAKQTQPILLLDDVFSELDDTHRAHVITTTKNQQTIISAVANESIPKDFLDSVKVVRVEEGRVEF